MQNIIVSFGCSCFHLLLYRMRDILIRMWRILLDDLCHYIRSIFYNMQDKHKVVYLCLSTVATAEWRVRAMKDIERVSYCVNVSAIWFFIPLFCRYKLYLQ